MSDTYTQLTGLRDAGMSYRALAKVLGVSVGYVAGVLHRGRKAAGETRRRSPLTERQVAEILVRAKRGERVKDIAEKVGVPFGTVAVRMMRFRHEGRLEYRYDKGMSDA